jgi:hypothetical protein
LVGELRVTVPVVTPRPAFSVNVVGAASTTSKAAICTSWTSRESLTLL